MSEKKGREENSKEDAKEIGYNVHTGVHLGSLRTTLFSFPFLSYIFYSVYNDHSFAFEITTKIPKPKQKTVKILSCFWERKKTKLHQNINRDKRWGTFFSFCSSLISKYQQMKRYYLHKKEIKGNCVSHLPSTHPRLPWIPIPWGPPYFRGDQGPRAIWEMASIPLSLPSFIV